MAGKYPGKIGWLQGPSSLKKPRWYLPHALDNDAFSAWEKKTDWSIEKWRKMLQWALHCGKSPLWILVPDVVSNKEATLDNWELFYDEARSFGWPLAFAAQDGMGANDVPENADVVFIGGTTKWKWSAVPEFTMVHKRVHVGRVNTLNRLWECHDLGVESVDGTGWFREGHDGDRMSGLLKYMNGERS